jgi:hypothetical protein
MRWIQVSGACLIGPSYSPSASGWAAGDAKSLESALGGPPRPCTVNSVVKAREWPLGLR